MNEHEPARVFVSLTGKTHDAAVREWGNGTACEDSWSMGTVVDGVRGDVTCKRCLRARADG